MNENSKHNNQLFTGYIVTVFCCCHYSYDWSLEKQVTFQACFRCCTFHVLDQIEQVQLWSNTGVTSDSDGAPCLEPKLSLTNVRQTLSNLMLLLHQTKTAVPNWFRQVRSFAVLNSSVRFSTWVEQRLNRASVRLWTWQGSANDKNLVSQGSTPRGGGGTPIHYLYGYVPPNEVVILKLLI